MSSYAIAILIIACALLCFTYLVDQKKKQLDKYAEANKNVAVILLVNRHKQDDDYAKENIVMELDGLKADIFSYKIGIQAVCTMAGNHVLKAKSKWKVRENRGTKKLSLEKTAGPMEINIQTQASKYYSLNYNIKEKKYEFVECDPDNLFD